MNRRYWTVEEVVIELTEWSKSQLTDYITNFVTEVSEEITASNIWFVPTIQAPRLKVAVALWPLSGGAPLYRGYWDMSRYRLAVAGPRTPNYPTPADCRSFSTFVRKRNLELRVQHGSYFDANTEDEETERLWLEAGKKLPK